MAKKRPEKVDLDDPTLPDGDVDHLTEFFDDVDEAPEHPQEAAPEGPSLSKLEEENALLKAQLAEVKQAVPPQPGERVMRRENRADGEVEEMVGSGSITRINPLNLLTPKDPDYYYRWVRKERCAQLKGTGWEFVQAKSSLLAGIEGLPVDGIAQLHDLVCMRIKRAIYEERRAAVRDRNVKKKMKAAETLRERMGASGERIFGAGARRGLFGR